MRAITRSALCLVLVCCGGPPVRPLLPGADDGAAREAPAASARLGPDGLYVEPSGGALDAEGRWLVVRGGRLLHAIDLRDSTIARSVWAGEAWALVDRVLVTDRAMVELDTGRATSLPAHGDHLRRVVASPDGRHAVRLWDDRTLTRLDLRSGRERPLHESDDSVFGLWYPRPDRVVVELDDATRILDPRSGRTVARLPGGDVELCAGGRPLLRKGEDGGLLAHSLDDGALRWERPLPEGAYRYSFPPQVDPDAIRALAAGTGERLILDPATGEVTGRFEPLPDEAVRPAGADAIWGVDRERCRLVRVDADGEVERIASAERVDEDDPPDCGLSVSGDGSRVAFVTTSDGAWVFDASSGDEIARIERRRAAPLGPCEGADGDPIADGLVVRLHPRHLRVGGCEPPADRAEDDTLADYVGEDIGESGVLGRSADDRYEVRAGGPIGERDDYEWEAEVVIAGGELDEAVVLPGVRTECQYMRDQTPEGGWYSYHVCGGDPRVSEDGRWVVGMGMGAPAGTVWIVDARAGTRREVPLDAEGDAGLVGLRLRGDVLAASAEHDGFLLRLTTGDLRRASGPVVLGEGVALAPVDGALVGFDLPSLERRWASEAVEGARWQLSVDGSALVAEVDSALLVRDVATGEPRAGEDPMPVRLSRLTRDATGLVECRHDRFVVRSLAGGSMRVLDAEDGCAAPYALVLEARVLLIGGARPRLVRLADGAALELLDPVALGRDVWTVWAADGRFWAPPDALAHLRYRAADEAAVPAAGSPRLDPTLLSRFLAGEPIDPSRE